MMMKRKILVRLLAVLIVLVPASLLTVSAFSSPVVQSTPSFSQTNELSAIDSYGLQIHISESSAQPSSGAEQIVTVSEFDTLANSVNLSRASNWALPGFTQWPCPVSDMPPISISVYSGYYTMSNISSADALHLSPLGYGALCPNRGDWSSIVFHPSSDTVTSYGTGGSQGATFALASSTPLQGYYNGTEQRSGPNDTMLPVLIPFAPGTYTVAGGDEWSGLVLLYFNVV